MRVKKSAASAFAGWWVRTEKNGAERGGESRFLSRIAPLGALKLLRHYLAELQLDVTDRDDPPCHTFGLLGVFSGGLKRNFYQAGESRIEPDGLAAWDLRNPIQVGLVKVDPETLPLLRQTLAPLAKIPVLDSILKSSDLLNGL
jgi:hypothetical protein